MANQKMKCTIGYNNWVFFTKTSKLNQHNSAYHAPPAPFRKKEIPTVPADNGQGKQHTCIFLSDNTLLPKAKHAASKPSAGCFQARGNLPASAQERKSPPLPGAVKHTLPDKDTRKK
jgi:hypothetical protein